MFVRYFEKSQPQNKNKIINAIADILWNTHEYGINDAVTIVEKSIVDKEDWYSHEHDIIGSEYKIVFTNDFTPAGEGEGVRPLPDTDYSFMIFRTEHKKKIEFQIRQEWERSKDNTSIFQPF